MHRRIFLIPLDSRPVCYDLPKRLATVAGLELCLPSPNLLGSPAGKLKQPADFKALQRWVKNHLVERDPVIVALDTIAYGGLIPSRSGDEPLSVLEERTQTFFKTVRASTLFGFSSILRIPNYNNAEEEPDYWSQYGQCLYQYSMQLHQQGAEAPKPSVPPAVLSDFLNRRTRNFALNKAHVDRLAQGQLDYLIFCQDDTGPHGLNVQEAQVLETLLDAQQCSEKGHLQTGADEVASCMLARWMVENGEGQDQKRLLKVFPFYSAKGGQKIVAKFDGVPLEAVVARQLKACGVALAKTEEEADLWLLVHTPEKRQGDHCENLRAQVHPKQGAFVLQTLSRAFAAKKPVILADVAHANGSDPDLTALLLSHFEDLSGLYGYAGWNTPGNTIGTALAMGVIRCLAEAQGKFNRAAFQELLLIRLGDDWLYQADVRYTVRQLSNGSPPNENLLNTAMADGLALLKERLGLLGKSIHCSFPCHRTFEIEIGIR